ncbi:DEAD/DEAH box helicase [Pseudomonas syringae pv. actinidiae]|nr:DEAD/DEAH box helicase [Pseudomonas syringae pv. actinidiae]
MIKHLGAMARLAGLFHDIGKASAGFQRKLKTGSLSGVPSIHGPDPVKHELMGVLIIQSWMRATFGKLFSELTDREWLTVMANEQAFQASLNNAFPPGQLVPLANLAAVQRGDNDFYIDGLRIPSDTTGGIFRRSCTRFALLFLVLSHHRMPDNRFSGKQGFHPLSAQSFLDLDGKLHKGIWNQIPQGGQHLWNGADSHWLSSVSSSAQDLLETLDAVVDPMAQSREAGEAFICGVVHIARAALILADFEVSSRKGESPQAAWEHSAVGWANTRDDQSPGQPLDYHLVRVGDYAERYLYKLYEPGVALTRSMPVIERLDLPEKFQWQIRAQSLLASLSHDQGMMIFLMAGTGTGKTIAAARIMKAVSPSGIRFTVALGLRTLTLQVIDSYKRDIGFKDNEAALIMGSDVEKRIFATQANHYDSGDHHGLGDDYEHVVVGQRSISRLDEKLSLMQETPVVVATIDSIIDAAVSNKNSGLISTVRVMTSDLVLDEVDSYSESDLVSVAKLVYLTGFFGRKVIVSSATTTPEISRLMFTAYSTGYRAGAHLRNCPASINVAWVSEEHDSNAVIRDATLPCFVSAHEKYTHSLKDCLDGRLKKRMADLLDISFEKGIDQAFSKIKNRCIKLSEQHFEVDERTGKQLSFGLVRLSTIENCKDFSLHLIKQPDVGCAKLKICTYHSQQMVGFQHLYEEFYNDVLSRKPVGDKPRIFDNHVIRKILDSTDAERVMVVMVSSPIEEVGRDHDFDWAVVEPTSLRAIVQTAGRVLRHREFLPSAANVCLLSKPLRAIKYPCDPAFAYPGPETHSALFSTFTAHTSLMVDMRMLSRGVDSSECILPVGNIESELSRRERKVQSHYFDDKIRNNESAEGYLFTPALRFGGSHNDKFKFRGENSSVGFAMMPQDDWKVSIDGKEAAGDFNHSVELFDPCSDLWLYTPTKVEVDQRYRSVFSHLSDERYHSLMYVFSVQEYGLKGKSALGAVTVPKVAFSVHTGAFKLKTR